ncbi:nestin [Phyllopteryx taeniolatus]|uniref:nestin n=1 Tax=Phyllopteryx taeniolatus TaxID=161469 RepID=UPI002AD39929|nr:nestin [Phyllopteryx taeniolatus]
MMDLHIPAHSRHVAQEKHQMLDLNRRLQSYLGRVKLLEEENTLLAQEIQTLRYGHRGASVREKSLKEDLHRARAELDEVWRERVYAQMEVCRMSNEMRNVERTWQKEAQEQVEVRAKIEVSRKELEEEHGAQRWLSERISQLEQEMEHLVRNHEEDVAHLEVTLSHSAPPCFTPTPDLFQLEKELCQRASRAWQETAEAYQGQLDQLEESLKETGARLCETERHKNKYQAQLWALERERISEGDVKTQLEETAVQQREEHRQQINTLQEHWEGLEKEKHQLGQQFDLLVKENRGLLQQKMSLGLEVVTYRALLDGESLRRDDLALLKESRNISLKDAPVKPLRANYQLPAHSKTLTSVWRPPITSTTPLRSKPITVSQAQKDEDTTMREAKQESLYPKILHNGAMEEFRAQEVDEKVIYAEALSSPGEEEREERPAECTDGGKVEEHGRRSEEKAAASFLLESAAPPLTKDITQYKSGTQEQKTEILEVTEETFSSLTSVPVEAWMEENMQEEKAADGFQLRSGASLLTKEISNHQSNTQELTPDILGITEKTISSSVVDCYQEQSTCLLVEDKAAVDFQLQLEAMPLTEKITQHQSNSQELKSELLGMTEDTFSSSPSVPVEVRMEEDEQEEKSSSGTEALLQDTPEPSRLFSQCEFNPVDTTEISQEIIYSTLGTTVMEGVDVLYPDGEEMDTWDSVIDKKVHVESSEPKQEAKRQYAEPEEDISTRRSEPSREEMKKQKDEIQLQREEFLPHPDDNDEDEDSQNVSVSWRTELESDSYAQENTLADTRPLIRYTSDEMDANTQASHVDESESSDGEQDGKIGELGGTAWRESTNKNFGTMEDLCEEVEEEVLEYDLEYSHTDLEASGLEKETSKVSEDNLNKEVAADVDNVELETDQLVEQELENLSTDRYAFHFAQALADESHVVLPEDEDHGMMTMEQEIVMESDVQVTRKLELRDTRQLQRWQELQEEMKIKEEALTEYDVQVEREQNRRSSTQPQWDSLDNDAKEKVEEKEVQDGIMMREQEVITESDVQVECKLDLMDSVRPQRWQEVEEEEVVLDGMIKMEEVITESDVQVECDQNIRDSMQPQFYSQAHDAKEKVEEEEMQYRIMNMEEEVLTESHVQVERDLDFEDSMQLQLDSQARYAKEKAEEKEIQDAIITMDQEIITESGIQVERELYRRDLATPQLDTVDDEEKVLDEIITVEQEKGDKGKLPSGRDTYLHGEDNMDLGDSIVSQLDITDNEELEKMEEKEAQDRVMKIEEIITKCDVQVEREQDLMDSMQPQLDTQARDAKEKVEEEELQNAIMTMKQQVITESGIQVERDLDQRDLAPPQLDTVDDEEKVLDEIMTMEQEEDDKRKLPSCVDPDLHREGNLDLGDTIVPQLDTLDDEEMEEQEVQDGMIMTKKEEANRVIFPSHMDPDFQVEENLDLGNFVQPQLDTPDEDLEEVQNGIKQKEEQKVYMLSCRESNVQVERNLDLVQPQVDSPDDSVEEMEEKEVQDGMLSMEQEEANKVNLPYMDPDVQVEDNLNLRHCIPAQLDSPDDFVEEVKDEMLKQEEAEKLYLLSCMESVVQVERNLELVQPQVDSPDDDSVEEMEEKEVQDGMLSMEQEEANKVNLPYMDPDVQVEDNLNLRHCIPAQLDSPDDFVEEVKEEMLKQEEAEKLYLLSCMESVVQVERNLELVQPQVDSPDDDSVEEMEEKEVQDGMLSMEQEEANKVNLPYMDPDVQVEDNLNLRHCIPAQLDSPDDFVEEVKEEMLKQEEAEKLYLLSCMESVVQVERNLELVQPQLDSPDDDSVEEMEEKEVEDGMLTMEQEEADKVNLPYMDPDVQVEDNLNLRDCIPPQLDSPDDFVEEVKDEMLKQEEAEKLYLLSCMESVVQVQRNLELVQPQLDSPDDDSVEEMEEKEVEDGMLTMEQEEADKVNLPYMDPDVQVEDNLNLRDCIPPQLDSPDDFVEEVKDEMLKQEEAEKLYLLSCMESVVQVQRNLELVQPQLDSPDDDSVEEMEEKEVEDGMLTMEEQEVQDGMIMTKKEEANRVILPSHMDPDFQVEENLDLGNFVQPQLDTPDEDLEEVQNGIKQKEEQKVYMLSCRESNVQVESNLDLVQPQVDSPDDDSVEEMEEKEVQDGMLSMEQEEANKVNLPYMDPDVQVEDNLNFRDFILPQLDCPDDFAEEVKDEMLKKEEADKLYLLSCMESVVQVERNLNLLQPQLDSPDDEEKVQDKIMTKEEEVANNVNFPFCMDPNVQVEDNLDLRDFIQPKLDSPDDYVKDVQDVTINQEDAIKMNLPVCIDTDLQIEDNLGLRDIVQPQLGSPDKKDTDDEVVQEVSEAPEKREDEFELNVSMVTHSDETFSEFLCGPDVQEEDKEEECLEKPQSEYQNQESLLQQYTFSVIEDVAGHLADEWNVLGKTSEDIDIRHPKDQRDSVVSHFREERGDGESSSTFDEDPVEISTETLPEETVIIAMKHSSSEFHKTNGKDKRDFWASSLKVDAAYRSDIPTVTSAIHDVEFGSDLDWGKAVNGSSAHECAAKKEEHVTGVSVHSDESEVEGGAWSSGDE